MAGSNNLVTLALVGLGGYLVYEWLFAPSAAASTATNTAAAPPSGTTTTSTPPASTAPAFNSLDAIYARVAAKAGSAPQTPDQFNFLLNQELPSGKSAPDPLAVFTDSGFDRAQTMSLSNWWGAVAPWLKTTYGLSGLGVFGGLGALARGARGMR